MANSSTAPVRALGDSYNKPFRGLPTELRLKIWKRVVLPIIHVTKYDPDQTQSADYGPYDVEDGPPVLLFDPPLQSLTSLRAVSKLVSAEVNELLEGYGIALDAGLLQDYPIQRLLGRFYSAFAPPIALLIVRGRQLKQDPEEFFVTSFGICWNDLHKPNHKLPRLACLDYHIDMHQLCLTANKVAIKDGEDELDALDAYIRALVVEKALEQLGFSVHGAGMFVGVGFPRKIRLIIRNCILQQRQGKVWDALVNGLKKLYRSNVQCEEFPDSANTTAVAICFSCG